MNKLDFETVKQDCRVRKTGNMQHSVGRWGGDRLSSSLLWLDFNPITQATLCWDMLCLVFFTWMHIKLTYSSSLQWFFSIPFWILLQSCPHTKVLIRLTVLHLLKCRGKIWLFNFSLSDHVISTVFSYVFLIFLSQVYYSLSFFTFAYNFYLKFCMTNKRQKSILDLHCQKHRKTTIINLKKHKQFLDFYSLPVNQAVLWL